MLREQNIPLPRDVIERALKESDDPGLKSLIERVFTRILDGTPQERFALMHAALPHVGEGAEIYSYPCVVQGDQFRRVEEFCAQKNLNPLVLITGAMLLELRMTTTAKESPRHS